MPRTIALFTVALLALPVLAWPADGPPDPDLGKLVKGLKDRNAKVRQKAAEALGAKGKDAAPVARELCGAILDPSSKVAEAALVALESVQPELYKPLRTFVLDPSTANVTSAVITMRVMEGKALPAVDVLLARLRKDATAPFTGLPAVGNTWGLAKSLMDAVKEIGPEDPAVIKTFTMLASGGAKDWTARIAAIDFLDERAGDDAAKRKDLVPLLVTGLAEEPIRLKCIAVLKSYGPLARPALPALRKLRLSPNGKDRDAADEAVRAIEGP